MKAPRARVIIAIVAGVPATIGAWLLIQNWMAEVKQRSLPPPPPHHEPRLVVEPANIDLGRRSPCDGLIRISAVIRNDSKEPALIDDWAASCGCTVPFGELRKGMIIPPGESRRFEVTSDAWTTTGKKTYTLDFIERMSLRPIRLTITYIVESPLSTNFGYLIRSTDPVTTLEVKSRDLQPFRVLSIEPPIASVDPGKSTELQKIDIEWAKVDAALGSGWLEHDLQIHTDREDCPVLHFRIQGPAAMPEAPESGAAAPPVTPARPPDATAAPR